MNRGENGHRGKWLTYVSIAFPVTLCIFALNHSYPLALILGGILGVGFMGQFTLINTLLQNNISDAMRGRVMSLYTLTFFGFAPFGNLAIGAIAERSGLSNAIAGSAVIAFILVVILHLTTPTLRALP